MHIQLFKTKHACYNAISPLFIVLVIIAPFYLFDGICQKINDLKDGRPLFRIKLMAPVDDFHQFGLLDAPILETSIDGSLFAFEESSVDFVGIVLFVPKGVQSSQHAQKIVGQGKHIDLFVVICFGVLFR